MISIIYSTIGKKEDAQRIARVLVDEHLVACVNIIPSVTSVYRWKGKVEEEQECVLLAKTHKQKVKHVIQRLKSLHTYELPDIVAIPVTDGLKEYISYVEDETR